MTRFANLANWRLDFLPFLLCPFPIPSSFSSSSQLKRKGLRSESSSLATSCLVSCLSLVIAPSNLFSRCTGRTLSASPFFFPLRLSLFITRSSCSPPSNRINPKSSPPAAAEMCSGSVPPSPFNKSPLVTSYMPSPLSPMF